MTTSPTTFANVTPGFPLRDHPLRLSLTNEVHARPPEALTAPIRASLIAMLSGETAAEADRAHLEALCIRAGAAAPTPGGTHHSVDLGTCRLKWERHTEFSTYTIFRAGGFTDPFAEPALAALPPDWLKGVAGELLVGVHIALLPVEAPLPNAQTLVGIFGSDAYVGARLTGGAATVWTDFRIHGDGFSRILVADQGMSERQAGRVAQRLLEIETYRMMALLALPMARSVLPKMAALESQLAELTDRATRLKGLEDEKIMLDELNGLAAQTERVAAETGFRFAAARAYYDLVQGRVQELREQRIEGLPTLGEFMERRLAPAMKTCATAESRRAALSERVARATTLLRTRVDIAVEAQNADLLRSMDRRADLQLRLQETVEGLSVVAISYYLIGLIGYAAKGLKAAGVPLNPDVAVVVAIPFVLGVVWKGVRSIREAVGKH
ncbi:MAG TPA: DUF3422 domain-containing protein [Azospirillaceae bacterium]|nr:DUF3422 domain-containing protein [Azospirillaceae bacterium]